MKVTYIVFFVFLFLGTLFSSGQTRSTKATKIVLIVNEKSNSVEHMELLASFQKKKKKELAGSYTNRNFFLGVLKGTYSLENERIIPGNNTTIILYTEKQFAIPEPYVHGDSLTLGDTFNLGKIKAKVVANKKGELILKTQ